MNPVFQRILAPYAPKAALERIVNVPAAAMEVALSSDNPSDPETWRTAMPTDNQLIHAVQLLIERHAVELDEITANVIEGKA